MNKREKEANWKRLDDPQAAKVSDKPLFLEPPPPVGPLPKMFISFSSPEGSSSSQASCRQWRGMGGGRKGVKAALYFSMSVTSFNPAPEPSTSPLSQLFLPRVESALASCIATCYLEYLLCLTCLFMIISKAQLEGPFFLEA